MDRQTEKAQLWRRRLAFRCCPAGAFSPRAALVIVESPGKTRTINQILGSGYVVRASLGHVRDLPQPKRDGRSPGKQRQQVGRGLDIVGRSDPTT